MFRSNKIFLGGWAVIIMFVLFPYLLLAGTAAQAANKPQVAPTAVVAPADVAPAAINYGEAMVKFPHNKIVHFPVALGMAAVLFALLSLRWPSLYNSCRLLLFLAAVGAVAALITGKMQAGEFLNGPLRLVLHTHAMLGFFTMLYLWLGFSLSYVHGSRRWLWIPLLLLACLITATGYFGGILATS